MVLNLAEKHPKDKGNLILQGHRTHHLHIGTINTSVHNLVPTMISGVDPKFKTTLLVTSELKHDNHPSFNCTRVKLFKNGDYLIVGDTPKDCAILQNESKMNAALGPNVKVSLPQTFHSARKQSHKVLVKGVSTDIKQEEFENMLTQNKTTFAKAERFISKRSGMPLPMFSEGLTEDCWKPTVCLLDFGRVLLQ